MRSILTKLGLAAVLLSCCTALPAQSKFDPSNQIRWPPCAAGQPYVPYGNTCGGSLNIQPGFNQQASGQFVLVPFTVAACSITSGACTSTNGALTPFAVSSGSVNIDGGASGTLTFSSPQLPAGVTAAQVTDVYAVGSKAMFPHWNSSYGWGAALEIGHLGVTAGSGITGCTLAGGVVSAVPMQYACHLSASSWANFNTLTASAGFATNTFRPGGTYAETILLEVHYTGTPITEAGAQINLGPGFQWDSSTETLNLMPFALYPISVTNLLGLQQEPEFTENLVFDGATSTDCATGGGTFMVWCQATGAAGTYTGSPFVTPAYSIGVVQSLAATGLTGNWSPAAYTTPAAGMYRFSYYISPASGSGSPVTDLHVTYTNDHASGNFQDWSDTWSGTFPTWDWDEGVIYATSGSTITPTITVTGTINYNVRYKLEYLGP